MDLKKLLFRLALAILSSVCNLRQMGWKFQIDFSCRIWTIILIHNKNPLDFNCNHCVLLSNCRAPTLTTAGTAGMKAPVLLGIPMGEYQIMDFGLTTLHRAKLLPPPRLPQPLQPPRQPSHSLIHFSGLQKDPSRRRPHFHPFTPPY